MTELTQNAPPPSRWFRRRQVLLPTWRGCLVLVVLGVVLLVLLARNLYGFLSVNDPLHGRVLVVEGWLADSALKTAAQEVEEFRRYDKIYVTGGPLERGAPLSEFESYARLGAAVLAKFGVNTNAIVAVPAPWVAQDRTYVSALTLKKWFEEHDGVPPKLTLVTYGAHSRRSRLLFQKGLGANVDVGVIAVDPEDFDPGHWWGSSAGVRTVVGEVLAYGYARLIFRP